MFPRKAVPVFLSLLASWSGAQPRPGDWILSDAGTTIGGLLSMNPATGALATLAPGRPAGYFNWVAMDRRNRDVAALYSGGPFHLVTVSPAGELTTVAAVGGYVSPNGLDLDQDGSWIATTSGGNGLYRIDPLTGVARLLTTLPGTVNNVAIDQDTGDYIVAIYGSLPGGELLRVRRGTLAVSTIASGLGRLSSVDHEPATGQFLVTAYDEPLVRRVHPAGSVTPVSLSFPGGANVVKVDDETGDLLVGGRNTQAVLSPAGAIRTTRVLPPDVSITGVEVYGSRKVSGRGSAAGDSLYHLSLSFPSSPFAPYLVVMSTALRPGIPLGDGTGRVIRIDPTSPIFRLSLGGIPGITEGFVGNLDQDGRADPRVWIPPGTPAGLRLFFTAVVVNPAFPAGVETANTWAFTTTGDLPPADVFATPFGPLPATVVTSAGPQATGMQGECELRLGPPDGSGVRPVEVGHFVLSTPSVNTAAGPTGGMSFRLAPGAGRGTWDPDAGNILLGMEFEVSYKLIDLFRPPVWPPLSGLYDLILQSRERWGATFAGTARLDPEGRTLTLYGVLMTNAKERVSDQTSGGSVVVSGQAAPRKVYTLPGCAEDRRCNKRRVCVQPVFVQAPNGAAAGDSLATYQAVALRVWEKCCIELDFRTPLRVVQRYDITPLVVDDPEGPSGMREIDNILGLWDPNDDDECVEVFFISGFTGPTHWAGDGACWGSGSHRAKVLIADVGASTDPALLAHELGHALGLDSHLAGTVMEPTGNPPNPPGPGPETVNAQVCRHARTGGTLTREKAPKTECCLDYR